MGYLINIAVAAVAGLLLTRVFNKWHLPDVTAFLVAGVLIGPFFLGRLQLPGFGFASYDEVASLSIVSDVALGFIAFSIGSEFRISQLKKIGKTALFIGVFQALTATLFVDVALLIFHVLRPDIVSVPVAVTLGAIATATAPAATMMVIRQYKAKGEITELLLPIVALDDAVGLVVFAVSFGIAKALATGALSIVAIVVNPLIEIAASLVLGAVAGFILTKLETLFRSNSNRLILTISFVFATIAISMKEFDFGELKIGFSSLLVCMMLGMVFCNYCPLSEELMTRADKWSAPVLTVFFVISGASLQLEVFSQGIMVLVGVVYIISRSLGKYYGARASARIRHCSPNVVKYLGITLLPQAGVALGMVLTAQSLPGEGEFVRSTVLLAVLIYELIGPVMTKNALANAGEISEIPKEVLERRQHKLEQAPKKELVERAKAKRQQRTVRKRQKQ